MIESILDFLSGHSPFLIYVILFLFSYVENVFPPSPSDLVVVIGGSLIATGSISFIPTLLVTTSGSILGFMTLYYIGSLVDKKFVRAGKMKFISPESLDKAEKWFNKWGYWIIAANRFLPGTRSVISFFAGLSELGYGKTILLASISALIWNAIIIYLGIIFGNNIEVVDFYLSRYQTIVLIVTGVVILFFVIRYFFFSKKKSKG
ncbi:MAG: DedA family protein [Ignavibacteriales bacterium]|nr:MAG: DedA family protein [Ignavibacteriales bacterium]